MDPKPVASAGRSKFRPGTVRVVATSSRDIPLAIATASWSHSARFLPLAKLYSYGLTLPLLAETLRHSAELMFDTGPPQPMLVSVSERSNQFGFLKRNARTVLLLPLTPT